MLKVACCILTYLLISFFTTALASDNSPGLTQNNLKIFDIGVDVAFLTSELFIFDNVELKGNPIFVVGRNQITNTGSGKKLIFTFDKKLKKNKNVKQIGFLKIDGDSIYLAVDSFDGNIARVKQGNDQLYLRLSKSYFVNKDWPKESLWKEYIYTKDAYPKIKKIATDMKLQKKINEIRSCIDSKNIQCFINQLIDKHRNGVLDELANRSKQLLKKSCEDEVKNSETDAPWDAFKKIISFNPELVSMQYREKNFEENPDIEINFTGQCICNVCEDISSHFMKNEYGEWDFYIYHIFSTP